MPILAKLMIGLVGILTNIFGRFFVLEKAFKMAAMASILLLTTALYMALRSCVTGVCGSALGSISNSHPSFAVGLGMVFNSTTYAAASCYISVWTLCQLYVIKRRSIDIFK